jgi:predicted TIM-barrel fold metal-dependent hydrolase
MQRVALLERYLPDRAARDRVLVDNPAHFFGFSMNERAHIA